MKTTNRRPLSPQVLASCLHCRRKTPSLQQSSLLQECQRARAACARSKFMIPSNGVAATTAWYLPLSSFLLLHLPFLRTRARSKTHVHTLAPIHITIGVNAHVHVHTHTRCTYMYVLYTLAPYHARNVLVLPHDQALNINHSLTFSCPFSGSTCTQSASRIWP
jgi:hypothetical protein